MTAKLQVSSIHSYIDEELAIKVTGCKKSEEVTIYASAYDEKQKKFSSYASFIANKEGIVNVSSQQPIAGSYSETDASGLFWSMKHVDSSLDDYFEKSSADKISINLDLQVEGKKVDAVTINRYFYMDNIIKENIEHERLSGSLFYPKQKRENPAVLILGGSDGGMQEHAAALLASKGYTTFALPYFGVEGLPKNLENISLEYFQEATSWLKAHPHVNGDINLIGHSRGGEIALLLGTLFDDYQSIVVSAPSAYVTPGMKNGVFASVPSWMIKQQALTYVEFKFRFRTISSMLKNWMMKRPISYLSIWDDTLKNQEEAEKSRIPVENIRIPVLFIAGKDDQLWPSSHYVKLMEKKFKSIKTTQRNHYLYYKNAGHFLSFPYSFVNLPANVFMNIGGKMIMTFGGTKQGNAEAAKDSWRQILTFLEKNNKSDKM
ncbi:alpha/beta fold hydrolase [Tetragenococcus halophilus]|uniref:alpha/beta fold hydrolase n=1 Tax=Tetragenococcus halophilus TaxID=51669 RepID=UPI001F2FCE82|nr:alpha/beta fold hydrolase [Tetragenococcus halophilus]MCF1685832.1 alpha/beta fold hydrolase [Tetragenococcus halophilus]